MNEMLFLDKQKSQSGQALVEYILLVAIAVSLILGLSVQFYRPFGNWMKDYMGPYVECLLDVGELPTVGGGTASGICAAKFKSGPKSSSANTSNSNHSRSSEDSTSGPAEKVRRAGDDTSSASNAGSSGRGSSGSNSGFRVGAQTGADGPRSGVQDGQKFTEKLPESQYLKLKSQGGAVMPGSSSMSSRGQYVATIPLPKNSQKEGEGRSVKLKLEEGDGTGGKSKKFIVKPSERKVASEEESIPWSFGQYIKFAVILMIIIAIVLFLGGQILQISKSMEK